MKKVLILVVILLLVIATGAAAQGGIPGSGWWSGEQIQNVSGSSTDIHITAYDATSGNTYDAAKTVGAGAAYTFVPGDFSGMPDGFQGSAVVSAGQAIKAIVNVTNRPVGSLGIAGGMAAAQYQGIDGSMVDTTLYFPLAKGDHYGKTTTFYIQNAGSSGATATATFTMQNGDVHTLTTASIGVNQMVSFSLYDTSTFNPGSAPISGKIGSLVVKSAQPMAGVVMEAKTSENPATILQSTRAFTSADFDTKAYAPQVKNNVFDRFTGIQVQNVSGGPINVTVTYKGSTGGCLNQTFTDTFNNLGDQKSYTFVQNSTSHLPNGCFASATVSANGNFLAEVNESYVGTVVPSKYPAQRSVASFAIPGKLATTKASAPLFKDDAFSKRSGMQVQNVGGATATNVVATFSCTTQSNATFKAITKPQTINSGSGFLFYHPSASPAWFTTANPFSSAGATCSVIVTADQPIVILTNEAVTPGATLQQDNNNYEGFNLAP